MATYARERGIGGRDWYFASADPATMARLTATPASPIAPSPKGFDHVTQTTILDASGRIVLQVYGEDFAPPLVVEPLKKLVWGGKVNSPTYRVADRPRQAGLHDLRPGERPLPLRLFTDRRDRGRSAGARHRRSWYPSRTAQRSLNRAFRSPAWEPRVNALKTRTARTCSCLSRQRSKGIRPAPESGHAARYAGVVPVLDRCRVSGIYVYIFFDTGLTQAWESLERLSHDQWWLGGIMRSLHRYASDALVVVVLLHALREFAMDRMRGNRWFPWVTGRIADLVPLCMRDHGLLAGMGSACPVRRDRDDAVARLHRHLRRTDRQEFPRQRATERPLFHADGVHPHRRAAADAALHVDPHPAPCARARKPAPGARHRHARWRWSCCRWSGRR